MNTFRNALRRKRFVVTAECFLKPETDAEAIGLQAELLKDSVDGALLTDNQYGRLHMSTLAAATLFLQHGLDPVMQLSCRNRNRIVLLADLFGAAALGVGSLLLVRGNHVPQGIEPRPKAVFDMSAAELIATAAALRDDAALTTTAEFHLGGIVTPHRPAPDWQPRKLIEKADAGAQFMLTYLCMDLDLLRRYLEHLVAAQLTRRVSLVVSTAILTSADDARWLRDNRPNVTIPDAIIERLDRAADARAEGIQICIEQLRELQDIPGVAGANILASADLGPIPDVVHAAGITDRRA